MCGQGRTNVSTADIRCVSPRMVLEVAQDMLIVSGAIGQDGKLARGVCDQGTREGRGRWTRRGRRSEDHRCVLSSPLAAC